MSDLFSGIINKAFGKYRDKLLKKTPSVQVDEKTDDEQNPTYVITVSREYGSGGRQIAKALAESLGFKYYDNELIKLVVEKSGYSPDFIEKNEQTIKNPLLHDSLRGTADRLIPQICRGRKPF